ncbi:MAG: NUDIX hydrolase [Vicinamibacterales bacterium]
MSDSRAGFTTLSRQTLFKGRVFDVTLEAFERPDHRRHSVEVVRHAASVVLLVVPEARSLVLVSQYRHPVGRRLWEVPAGTLEAGEDPLEAARRECEEETGYAPSHVERLGAFFAAPGYCDEEMIFYRATGLTRPPQPAAPDDDEDIETRTVSLDEARDMVLRGDIVDMKSALAIALFA